MFSDVTAALVTVQHLGTSHTYTYKNCICIASDLTGSEVIRCKGVTVARYDAEMGWTTNGRDSAIVTIA